MSNELLENLDKLHTTELGAMRIKHNIALETDDVVSWCKNAIRVAMKSTDKTNAIFRNGKNWYIKTAHYIITVNAYSYTIITAHPQR